MIPLQCGTCVERRNAVHLPVKDSRIIRVIHARPARRNQATTSHNEKVPIGKRNVRRMLNESLKKHNSLYSNI